MSDSGLNVLKKGKFAMPTLLLLQHFTPSQTFITSKKN